MVERICLQLLDSGKNQSAVKDENDYYTHLLARVCIELLSLAVPTYNSLWKSKKLAKIVFVQLTAIETVDQVNFGGI